MIDIIRGLLGMPKQKCAHCQCLEQRLKGVERQTAQLSVGLRQELLEVVERLEEEKKESEAVVAEMVKGLSALEAENAMLMMQVAEKDQALEALQAETAHILMHIAKEEN